MRTTFVKTLVALAEHDARIVLLTGDLGFMALEPFADRFPDRFFNVGVAEQNMVGLATGLAEAGFIPYIYSIVTFATLRPYEFIRNGPILHQLPVRIVGMGGGYEYGTAGPTHHGLEDVGVMRIQPGISVIAPADAPQAATALRETAALPGPVYYRLGKDDKTVIAGLDGRFTLGTAEIVREGKDVAFVTMGSVSNQTVAAAEKLAEQGISSRVLVVSSLNPVDSNALAEQLSGFGLVVTVEAHYVVGGVGSLVCETVAEGGLGCRVVRCGVKTTPSGVSGSQDFMHTAAGLNQNQLVETVLRNVVAKTSRVGGIR
jgi:transketolase